MADKKLYSLQLVVQQLLRDHSRLTCAIFLIVDDALMPSVMKGVITLHLTIIVERANCKRVDLSSASLTDFFYGGYVASNLFCTLS
jgi:hypothetical protein